MTHTLLDFLNQTSSYPHQPESVEHVQTHISHVFIVPPFVYKFKKAVDLDFLDFSTLEKRKYFCEMEVKLNRRLCRNIYLGVVPVYSVNNTFRLYNDLPGQEDQKKHPELKKSIKPVEYAVKMRLLEKKYFLKRITEEGELTAKHLDQLAEKLTAFYTGQQPDNKIMSYGKAETIRVNTEENFRQTRSFIGSTIHRSTYKAIQFFSNGFLERKDSLFERRMDQKRIVDGHGDLHLDHIHISDAGICIYDCIEFNERFRLQDVAADLAFLAMDLDFNHLYTESRDFIHRMSEKNQDPDLLRIMDFYKCYRAYVRGKVKSIESEEAEVPGADRKLAAETAGRYFNLALLYALLGSEPVVLLFIGRIASGKSTLAQQLAENLNLNHYSTDVIRKEIFGISPVAHLPETEREKLYQPEITEQTYNTLFEYGIKETGNGRSVILDGTFSRKDIRENWVEQFKSRNSDYIFVETTAPKPVRRKRLLERRGQNNIISDARLEEMELLDRRYTDPGYLSPSDLIRIDTDTSPGKSLEHLYMKLAERHLSVPSPD